MSDFNLDTEFRASVTLHQAGRLEQASQGYRRILAAAPHQPIVMGYLGMATAQAGSHGAAVRDLRRSLALSGEDAAVCNNLGNALVALGRREEASKAYRQAVALAPSFGAPQFGMAQQGIDRERHEARLLRTIACDAAYVPAYLSLAQASAAEGRGPRTWYWLRRAAALSPADSYAHAVIASALLDEGRLDASRTSSLRALIVGGDGATALFLLARAAEGLNDLDEARRRFRQCLASSPVHGASLVGLGSLELGLGRPDLAVASYEHAVAASAADEIAAGNLLFAAAFLDQPDPQAPVRLARRWAMAGGARTVQTPLLPVLRRPRRLRIGYVSPEFLKHSFLSQLLPVLEHHDRARYDVFAFGQAKTSDGWTDKVRERVDTWRTLGGLDLDAQADAIRSDGIDILVNLTGYLAHHRALFRRRMAPVQLAYINHIAPVGISSLDARITDKWLEPEQAPHVDADECLVRMTTGFSCLSPPEGAPDPGTLPASRNGYVTFGVVNNLAKVSRAALDAWSRILIGLPRSRIIIKAYGLSSACARRDLLDAFGERGIGGERVTLVGRIAADRDNLQAIAAADIALDPFPFNGGLSTGDALWMGVPVVSVLGSQLVGRLGFSFLDRAGFPEWIAPSVDAYVDLATTLASNVENLAVLRRRMRERLSRSVLFDAAGHTGELEDVCERLWRARAG